MDINEKVLICPQYDDIRLPQFETVVNIPDVYEGGHWGRSTARTKLPRRFRTIRWNM
jgi:hypothetical protein